MNLLKIHLKETNIYFFALAPIHLLYTIKNNTFLYTLIPGTYNIKVLKK